MLSFLGFAACVQRLRARRWQAPPRRTWLHKRGRTSPRRRQPAAAASGCDSSGAPSSHCTKAGTPCQPVVGLGSPLCERAQLQPWPGATRSAASLAKTLCACCTGTATSCASTGDCQAPPAAVASEHSLSSLTHAPCPHTAGAHTASHLQRQEDRRVEGVAVCVAELVHGADPIQVLSPTAART